MAVRGVFAVALLLVILPWLGLRIGRPERYTWLRAAGEVAVTFAFLAALARLPIGDTYTLYFAGPLLLTAGAALLLGERVGPRRWAAVLVGFLGVLVVLGLPREWQAASLIALRPPSSASPATSPPAGSRPRSAPAPWRRSPASASPLGLGHRPRRQLGPAGLVRHRPVRARRPGRRRRLHRFVVALRTGELSYVATFRYAGIPMAMLLGLAVWGDVPSLRMLAGAALIMAAGLYIVLRERALAR